MIINILLAIFSFYVMIMLSNIIAEITDKIDNNILRAPFTLAGLASLVCAFIVPLYILFA